MRRRRIIAFVLMVAVLLTACGSSKNGQEEVEQEENKQTITIWTWDETFNVKAAEMAAEKYQKEHSDIEIVIEVKEREEILLDTELLLSSNVYDELPDVIMIEDYDIQDVLYSYQDEFVDLTDLIDYDQYVDYKRELVEKDGRAYGIPFDCGTAALFYRVDILQEAGFSEADMQNLTWDRYIEIGKEVYAKTGIPMLTLDPTDMPLIRIIMQSCGSWYVAQNGVTANIEDNEALAQALEIYTELLNENIGMSVNGWNEFISAFQTGKVASVISGGWILSSIRAVSDQSGLWRVANIPVVSDNENAVAASNVGGSAWYILKNSASSDIATDFMVEMFAEDMELMDQLVEEIGIVPSLKDSSVLQNYSAVDPFFGGQSVTRLLTGFAAMIPTVNYGSKTYDIENILEEEYQNILPDGDIADCLERVQAKAEAVVRE